MNNLRPKQLKYSFLIICPDHSLNLLKTTVSSIKNHYPNLPYIAVVDEDTTKEDVAEMKKNCPIYKGKNTITSLINVGMRHSPSDWVFMIFAGSNVRPKLDEKFSFYTTNDKDVLFPIANNKYNFIEATLNGLCINKKTFKEVGELSEDGKLEMIKAEWASNAIDYGCRFKAIIGSKMC